MSAAPGFPMSEEAVAFAQAVDELLSKHADSAKLREAWDAPEARIPGLWERLDQLGFFELAAEGASALPTLVPAVVVTGRHALPEPLIGSLASCIATGTPSSAVVPAAVGPGDLVPDGSFEADLVPSIDSAARLGRIAPTSDDCSVPALLAAAQLQGLAEGLLTQASDYAKVREQFGKPIGVFQAVKHQLADVYIEVGFARPLIDEAARAMASGAADAGLRVSHAKLAATSAAHRAARTALQVHGGIGYTFEHDLHMWSKKVWTLSRAWGDERWHRSRLRSSLLG